MLELKLAQRFQKVAIAVFSLKVLVFKIAEKLKTPPHTHTGLLLLEIIIPNLVTLFINKKWKLEGR